MIDKVGSDLWGYSRAHMAYALFMYGFGVGQRMRQTYRSGDYRAQIVAERPLLFPNPDSPWDGGFGYGWRFESLGGGDG